MQLKPVKNTELYVTIIHQPVTVTSNMHVQPNRCTNEAFSSTSTRFNHFSSWCCFIPAKVGIKSCRCARECFICTCVWLHVLEVTAIGWWIIVTSSVFLTQLGYIAKLLVHLFQTPNFCI